MIVGCVREVKQDEYRVGLRPVGAELLRRDGHRVLVETGAGLGSGYSDDDYLAAGAEIIAKAAEVWETAELLVKVKEPQKAEIPLMGLGQQVFTYFHFAADRELTQCCLNRGICAIAYETLEQPSPSGRPTLPLLTPMSEVAGKMSIQEGAKYLERPQGGRGLLLGGVTGTPPATVLVLGGGVVGSNAARMAAGLGANVYILDINLDRLRYLDDTMPANVTPLYSDPHTIRDLIRESQLVVGAILISGAKAPHLIRHADLSTMLKGSVIVDVAIDQGGCVETARPTTHAQPTYEVDGVIHYCVANIPGAVPRTSTQALTNATMPWLLRIAAEGAHAIAARDPGFAMAINMDAGQLYNRPVAEAHGLRWIEPPFSTPQPL
ncbi:MAG: alanine dehydrogenase [Phycisphaerales bacterium]|nr:alanine dehydrogenase [Phycisphaerales bacterium]